LLSHGLFGAGFLDPLKAQGIAAEVPVGDGAAGMRGAPDLDTEDLVGTQAKLDSGGL
jgi:hypothetical protein